MTYQPGIPTGFLNLDQDYQNIQNNFTILNNIFQVDHTTLTNVTAQKGYHTAIHLIPQSTPTNAPGYGQIYSTTQNDGLSNDQTLFYQTGTGNLNIQLIRNILPVINTNGYTFLPGPAGTGNNQGALLVQWGSFTAVSQAATMQNFNISFPKACFGVWGNVQKLTAQQAQDVIYCYGFSGAGPVANFTYYSTSGSAMREINWIAIGY